MMFFHNTMTSNAFLRLQEGFLHMHVTQPPLFNYSYNFGGTVDEYGLVPVVAWTSPFCFYNSGCMLSIRGCGLDIIVYCFSISSVPISAHGGLY